MFTAKGGDLDLISKIHSEIFAYNLHLSFKPLHSQCRPFLPKFPDGSNGMTRTKNLSDIGTLTVHCTSINTYLDVLSVVSKEFKVTCAPGDEFRVR